MIKTLLGALRWMGVFGLNFDGGGGGGGSTTATQYTSNVPEYAKGSFMDLVGKAEALSQAPYQAYGGERVAQFSPLQKQAYGRAGGQQTAPQLQQASGIAGYAANQALGAGQYAPGTFTPLAVNASQLNNYLMGPAERVGTQSFTQPGAAVAYMSPFIGEALAPQLRELSRQSDIRGTQEAAQMTKAGAFGGSRDAIMRAERERNLMQQQGDVLSRGYQTAFEQAQGQFNQEQQARLAAQQANQQAGLTVGQANLQSLLGTQQLGAQQGMAAQQANQQALLEAQRMYEQSRQFGAQQGLQGLQTALQGASQLGQLGQQQFGQEMDITGLQQKMGAEQQAQIQRILDQQYADFREQRDYPYQQLGYLADVLRGAGGSTRSVYSTPQTSPLQTLAGVGTALYGASRMAEGGEVRGYADGGITSLLGDQQLQKETQQPRSPMMGMAAQQEMAERAQLRAAAPDGLQDASEVSDEQLVEILRQALQTGDEETAAVAAAMLEERKAMNDSGIAAVAPDSVGEVPEGGIVQMADGGQVGYAGGGTTWWERELLRLQDPNMLPPESDEPNFWTYSSDVEAQRKRREAAQAKPTTAGPDTGDDRQRLLARYPAPASVPAEKPPVAGLPQLMPPATDGSSRVSAGVSTGSRRPSAAAFGYDPVAEEAKLRAGNDKLVAAMRTAAEGELSDFEKAVAARGLYGVEREASAKEGLAGLADEREQAKASAIFQAGLAILAADPAKGAWSAIGSGALQGLGAFKGDAKELEKKREGLQNKLDEIADLRRQESIADDKERRGIQSKIRGVEVEGAKLYQDLAKDFSVNVKLPIAQTIFKETAETDRNNARIAASAASTRATQDQTRLTALMAEQSRMAKVREDIVANAAKPYEQFFKTLQENEARGLEPTPAQIKRYNEITAEINAKANRALARMGYDESMQILQEQIRAKAGLPSLGTPPRPVSKPTGPVRD